MDSRNHSHYDDGSPDDEDDGSGMDSDSGFGCGTPPSPARSLTSLSDREGRTARTVAMPKIIDPPKNLDLPPFLRQLQNFLNMQDGIFDDDMLLQEFESNSDDPKYLVKRLMEAQNTEFRLTMEEGRELARSRELGLFSDGHRSLARPF